MKQLRLVCIGVFVMSLVMSAVPAFAELKMSGAVNSDWGYVHSGKNDSRPYVDFQVRYILDARKELPSGVFMEAYAQVRSQVQGTQADSGFSTGAGVRDTWVMIGNKKIDLKLGRFEKLDVMRRSDEIIMAPVKSAAENIRLRVLVDSVFPRQQGDFALTYHFTDKCKFELAGVWFPSEFKAISVTPAKDMGIRPAFQYENESILIAAGAEYRHRATQDSNTDKSERNTIAGGGTIEKRFGRLAIAVSGAARHDHTLQADGSVLGDIDSWMMSGYVNIPVDPDRLGIYGGYTNSELKPKDWTNPAIAGEPAKRGISFAEIWYFHPQLLGIEGTDFGVSAGYTKAGKDEDETGYSLVSRLIWRF